MHVSTPQNPPISRTEFRDAMAHMASTVTVVAADLAGQRLGRTVTSIFSLNANPPSVLVSIDIASPLTDLILRSGGFSVSMLAHGQHDIADAFAGKLGDVERFSFGTWGQWPSGQPRLQDIAVGLDCELTGSVDAGSHILYAGSIIHTDIGSKEPLVWHDRAYRTIGL